MSKGLSGHIAAILFVAFLPAATCNNNGGKVTPTPPVVTDQSDCAAACEHLKVLACQEGNPIDMGTKCKVDADCKGLDGKSDAKQQCSAAGGCYVSCTNFCIETENQGVWLDPACVKNIKSCDDINSCPTPVKPPPSCTGPACPSPTGK